MASNLRIILYENTVTKTVLPGRFRRRDEVTLLTEEGTQIKFKVI
jgi:hypothetical protein